MNSLTNEHIREVDDFITKHPPAKQIPAGPHSLHDMAYHAVVRDSRGRLWEKVGRKTGLWVTCTGRPTHATGAALARRAPITVVKR